MNHEKRLLYWSATLSLLLIGLGYYLLVPVSHIIDLVQVNVQRVPKNEDPAVVILQRMDPEPQSTERWRGRMLNVDDMRLGMGQFHNVPQGSYRVLVPSEKCAEDVRHPKRKREYPPEVRGHFVAEFDFVLKSRWEQPYLVGITMDMERCAVEITFHSIQRWKWGF